MNQVATPYIFVTSSPLARTWRNTVLVLVLLLGWTLFIYRDTGIAMVNIWFRSETFAHAFLVPPIVLWLIWRQRRGIAVQTPQPSPGTLLAVAVVAFAWLLGELASVNAVTQLALVALLVLTAPAVLGWTATRLVFFPLGFLFFAVPIGEFLLPQLMEWTANVTIFALRLSGIPVYREGLNFVIPSGSWSVVEACSGVRYLIASLTVGTLFAYLNYQSTARRILFVIVSIVVPVIANWMRAYMIVMLGHLSGNKIAAGVDHLIYGWLFFGVVIMLMFIIGARWAEPEKMASKPASNPLAQTQTASPARLWAAATCMAVLVTLPHLALWAIDRGAGGEPVPFTAPILLAPDWQADPSFAVSFKPGFQNPTAEINNGYASQGRVVGLYLGYYQHQNYDRKLVSSSNVLVASQDPQWARVASGIRSVTVGGKQVAIRTAELRGTSRIEPVNESRLVAWQFYWIGGTVTASDYVAKAYGAFHRLLGRGDGAAVIVVYTLKDQAGDAESVLASFLSTNYASIDELLSRTRLGK